MPVRLIRSEDRNLQVLVEVVGQYFCLLFPEKTFTLEPVYVIKTAQAKSRCQDTLSLDLRFDVAEKWLVLKLELVLIVCQ